jgi:predicted enzyme related to lactoylglutathione lyase
MPPVVQNIAFDCADPYQLATFWSQVMGHALDPDNHPGEPEIALEIPDGPTFYFNEVPESKTVKNRVHVCLRPDVARDVEVERILGLGASILADHRNPDGTGWAVLADPEGNEFCVLRSSAERHA